MADSPAPTQPRRSRRQQGEEPEVLVNSDDENDPTFYPENALDPDEDPNVPLEGAVDSDDEVLPGDAVINVDTSNDQSESASKTPSADVSKPRTRSPNARTDLTPTKKTPRHQAYRPSADPSAELCALTSKAIRRACKNRPTWMHDLLTAVSRQCRDLQPGHGSRSSTNPDTLRVLAESYKLQLRPSRPAHPSPVTEPPPPPILRHPSAFPAAHPSLGAYPPPPPLSRTQFALPPPSVVPPAAPALPGVAAPRAMPQYGGQGAAWTQGFAQASSSGGVKWKTPEQVPVYPGMGILRPTLACQERMSLSILALLVSSGQDLETYVRQLVSQYRTTGGSSPAMAAEVVNLARIGHLLILEAGCPQAALHSTVIMEPLLRRLYALLQVEHSVNSLGMTRAQAWAMYESVLENRPDAHLASGEMDEFIHSRFNARAKFLANARREKSQKPTQD